MFNYMQFAKNIPGPIGDIANAAAGVRSMAGNLAGQHANAANQGALGARTLSTARAAETPWAVRSDAALNPYQQNQLAQQSAAQDLALQQRASQDSAAFNAGLSNQAANLEAERGAWANLQQQKAQNVANQLNALTQTRQTNAGLIASAMQAGAGAVPAGAYNM